MKKVRVGFWKEVTPELPSISWIIWSVIPCLIMAKREYSFSSFCNSVRAEIISALNFLPYVLLWITPKKGIFLAIISTAISEIFLLYYGWNCLYLISNLKSVHCYIILFQSITVIDSYIPNNFQNDIALLR